MRKNKALSFLLLAAMMAVFTTGLAKLFLMRFGLGDVYPPYSSLRSDPLGCRVLYEALDALPAVTVARNHLALDQRRIEDRAGLFFVGVDPAADRGVPKALVRQLDRFIVSGGRVLIAFRPHTRQAGSTPQTTCPPQSPDSSARQTGPEDSAPAKRCPVPREESETSSDPAAGNDEDPAGTASEDQAVSLTDHWGFRLAFLESDDLNRESPPTAEAEPGAGGLPRVIGWHTRTYFDQLADPWQVLYRYERHPVLVIRRMGKGSLVLVADAYPLSNEALRTEPQPALLAWMIGDHTHLVFDETHHGLVRQRGMMFLIRRYDLHLVILGGIVLALLYIWKQALPLVPPGKGSPPSPPLQRSADRDSLQGMISLLHRHIPPRQLLPTCVSELADTRQLNWRVRPETLQQMKYRLERDSTDPVEGYRTFCQMLKRKQP